jgi:hypothetical protein
VRVSAGMGMVVKELGAGILDQYKRGQNHKYKQRPTIQLADWCEPKWRHTTHDKQWMRRRGIWLRIGRPGAGNTLYAFVHCARSDAQAAIRLARSKYLVLFLNGQRSGNWGDGAERAS